MEKGPRVTRIRRAADEPPFWLIRAGSDCEICGCRVVGHGTALDGDTARYKAVGEHDEALALHTAGEHEEVRVWETEAGLGSGVVPLQTFAGRPARGAPLSPTEPRSWWPARSVDGRDVYVPIEAAILRHPGRGIAPIREPLSTGTAAGGDDPAALRRALREAIERDAFMGLITGRDPIRHVCIPSGIAPLVALLDERYRLKVELFVLCALARQVAAMALMLDVTGQAVAVTCGLGCEATFAPAAQKAILEAWQPRLWLRTEWDAGRRAPDNHAAMRNALDRGLHWAEPTRIHELQPLLEMPHVMAPAGTPAEEPLDELARSGLDVYTVPLPKLSASSVARVVVPALLPLFLDEAFRYGDSIVPLRIHPFL